MIFFPSINKKRVFFLLRSKRYGLSVPVSQLIANLVTFEGKLPQGAPTSPIISNMICSRLDQKLKNLARDSKAVYTRYADDLTFSTTLTKFEGGLATSEDEVIAPILVRSIVASEGFALNETKTRIVKRTQKMLVTGIKVNQFLNVERERIDLLRAIFHNVSKTSIEAQAKEYCNKQKLKYSLTSFESYIQGNLAFIQMVRGETDPIFQRLHHAWMKCQNPNYVRSEQERRISAIRILKELESEEDKQRAGYRLENAMQLLAEADGISLSGPKRIVEGALQVDGILKIEQSYFYLECKWTKDAIGADHTNSLAGKVSQSIPGAFGVMISKSGFIKGTNEAVRARTLTKTPLILISGDQLMSHLDQGGTLKELLIKLQDELVKS